MRIYIDFWINFQSIENATDWKIREEDFLKSSQGIPPSEKLYKNSINSPPARGDQQSTSVLQKVDINIAPAIQMSIQRYCTGPEILEKVDSKPLEYSTGPSQSPKKSITTITPFVFRKSGFMLSEYSRDPESGCRSVLIRKSGF